MREALFLIVIQMSLAGGTAVLVVMFARLLLSRAPKIFSYLLWGIVLFRLLCPVTVSTELSAAGLPGRLAEYSGGLPGQGVEGVDAARADGRENNRKNESGAALEHRQLWPGFDMKWYPNKHAAGFLFFGAWIWVAGMFGMVLYSIVSFLCFRRRLVGAVRMRDNIYQTDYISCPFVMGIFKPRIYLPSSILEKEMGYMLLHEQVHIRRKDHLWKLLAFAALCIHWFHPLVWLAFLTAGRDMEMSCDEAVIRQIRQDIRADYAASLLRLSAGRKMLTGTLTAFGAGGTGGRIRHIMRYQKPAAAVLATSAIVFAITAVVAGSRPEKTNGQDSGKMQDAGRERDLIEQGKELETDRGISDTSSQSVEGVLWMDRFGLDRDFAHQMQCAFLRSVTDDILEADPAEYIDAGDLERIRELGLSVENDLMDGYYFHNPDQHTVLWKLASDAEFIFVDWGEDFVQSGHPGDRFVRTTDKDLFLQYLKTYDPAPGMPFFFVVDYGTVHRIVEMPFA